MCCAYLYSALGKDTRIDTLRWTVNTLWPISSTFDTIVCQGISGLSVASPAAILLNKQLAIVRKRMSDHSLNRIEHEAYLQRFIILDDFIETGKTVKRILRTIKADCVANHNAKCVGVYLYNCLFRDIYNQRKILAKLGLSLIENTGTVPMIEAEDVIRALMSHKWSF